VRGKVIGVPYSNRKETGRLHLCRECAKGGQESVFTSMPRVKNRKEEIFHACHCGEGERTYLHKVNKRVVPLE